MVIGKDILNIVLVRKHYFIVIRRIASYLSRKISGWGLASSSPQWAIPEKSKQVAWGHGISRVIEKVECVNFNGQ